MTTDSSKTAQTEWLEKRYDLIHQRDIFTMFSSTYLDKCLTSGRGSVLAGIPKTSEWKVWTDPVSMDIVLRYRPPAEGGPNG